MKGKVARSVLDLGGRRRHEKWGRHLDVGTHECCFELDISNLAALGTWTLVKWQWVLWPREGWR